MFPSRKETSSNSIQLIFRNTAFHFEIYFFNCYLFIKFCQDREGIKKPYLQLQLRYMSKAQKCAGFN